MVDVSVSVEIVYPDAPVAEGIRRAAVAGAAGIEFWGWRDKDLAAIRAAADDHDVPIVACGAGGTLTDPDATDAAVETIRESIDMAAEHDIRSLIVTTGPDEDGHDRSAQHAAIVAVLDRVAADAETAGVTLALEPLNTAVDHPGYYLTSTAEGIEIVEAVGSERVTLLYDVYHQQITEGNIIATLREHVDRIGHVHIADVPGRHEPGTGELNYDNVVAALEEHGYDGVVGCEFAPTGDPDQAIADVLRWQGD